MNASWTNWAYKNVNADDARGPNGVLQGINWGFFTDNPNPRPDVNRDDAATVEARWRGFATRFFRPNSPLQEVFRTHATQTQA